MSQLRPKPTWPKYLKYSPRLFCIYIGTDVEAEGRDRSDINLPGQQETLLTDVVTKMQGKKVL